MMNNEHDIVITEDSEKDDKNSIIMAEEDPEAAILDREDEQNEDLDILSALSDEEIMSEEDQRAIAMQMMSEKEMMELALKNSLELNNKSTAGVPANKSNN